MSMKHKIILAYSGGLDTSIILPWLKETYGYEVIAMIADVGQGEDLTSVKDKAIKSGASKVYIEDLKEEFVNDFIFPALKAGAIYENKYLLGTSLSRPLIARRLVEIAKKECADIVCHGCTGKGNDQVRLELTINALNPHLKIVAPWRIWDIKSRQDAIDYAKARNIPIPVTKKHPYSVDANIWHSSHEGGELEDPWNEPENNVYQACTPPWKAPNQGEHLEIYFDKGIPVKVNGEELDGVELLKTINKIGSKHGVGIVDMVENRLVGIKSRGVYETPGGTILYTAHQHLESITLDKSTFHYKQLIAVKFGELVYDGHWYTPLRKALSAFVDSTQQNVSGRVRMKLYKGNCIPAGVQSSYSLYDKELATFEEDAVYDQKDAEGFIKIYGLPARINFMVEEKGKDNV